MRKIMFTGGGSAGHVTVNLALLPQFQKMGWAVDYIGSESGIEKQLICDLPDVRYHSIATGKLRRYFDWQNAKDPFKVVKGVYQAYRIIRSRKPDILFSKGGFVSVPVVVGAWLNKVPVVIHESDFSPGLANRISIPFAAKVLTTFPETAAYLPKDKVHHTGAVVRKEITEGDAERGRSFCSFVKGKPVLLIMGGSLGARSINEHVRLALGKLTEHFQIVHLCGKGHVDENLESPSYRQFEYIRQELPDVLAMSDMVVSRAGSNAIFEFLSVRKPMLLIPLDIAQSRGDQILNARSFEKSGYCDVLYEEELSKESLVDRVMRLYEKRRIYTDRMAQEDDRNSLDGLVQVIMQTAREK